MSMAIQIEQSVRSGASAVRSWNAPQIGGRALSAARGAGMPEDLQGPEKQAWQEAEAAGRAAGLSAALNALSRPLAHVDEEVHAQIAGLAVSIARGLLRRELRMDPTQIIDR